MCDAMRGIGVTVARSVLQRSSFHMNSLPTGTATETLVPIFVPHVELGSSAAQVYSVTNAPPTQTIERRGDNVDSVESGLPVRRA